MMDQVTRPGARKDEACQDICQDILRGADQVALFLFGDRAMRKKVYHLAEKSNLPIFRLGSVICARKTTLTRWIEDQERAAYSRG